MLRHDPIINPSLLAALAALGHGEIVIVADAGLPVGDAPRVIDLSLRPMLPSFADVAAAVLEAAVIESSIVAAESLEADSLAAITERIDGMPREVVTHEQFKQLTRRAALVVRSGDYTPYANVALVAGTAF